MEKKKQEEAEKKKTLEKLETQDKTKAQQKKKREKKEKKEKRGSRIRKTTTPHQKLTTASGSPSTASRDTVSSPGKAMDTSFPSRNSTLLGPGTSHATFPGSCVRVVGDRLVR